MVPLAVRTSEVGDHCGFTYLKGYLKGLCLWFPFRDTFFGRVEIFDNELSRVF